MRDGTLMKHAFPCDETLWVLVDGEKRPEFELETCPVNVVAEHPDVHDLFRAVNVASVSPMAGQSELPAPYVEAISVVQYHRDCASAWRMKVRDKSPKLPRGDRHGRK